MNDVIKEKVKNSILNYHTSNEMVGIIVGVNHPAYKEVLELKQKYSQDNSDVNTSSSVLILDK